MKVVERARDGVQGLTPGYFALVMASGIIAVGMKFEGYDVLSSVLLAICAIAFIIIVVLNLWRFAAYPDRVHDDFDDPRRAFGFFTFVAGTNVLGARLAMDGHFTTTAILLVIAGIVWIILGYVVPWTAVLGHQRRPVVAAANGTWFIWAVASQSVAIAAAAIEPAFAGVRQELALIAVSTWSIGVLLYAATGIFVAMRLMFFDFGPEDLTPPYWVSMGALSITVLAGARVVEMADAPMIDVTRDLIAGLAVVFWAFATWLVPPLVAAGLWRHLIKKLPLRYDATLWSIIFPLGMYATASIYLGQADDLPAVSWIGRAELWFAFAAWLLVFAVMLTNIFRSLTTDQSPYAAQTVRNE